MKNTLIVVGMALFGAAIASGGMYASLHWIWPWMIEHATVFIIISAIFGALRLGLSGLGIISNPYGRYRRKLYR
ncbi:MAG: hypothetical protein R3251_03350 [Candidatus Spechtbacterales bacterium]|nr:hypothetical protein [Candidatus Spechtbacterales bacterium]